MSGVIELWYRLRGPAAIFAAWLMLNEAFSALGFPLGSSPAATIAYLLLAVAVGAWVVWSPWLTITRRDRVRLTNAGAVMALWFLLAVAQQYTSVFGDRRIDEVLYTVGLIGLALWLLFVASLAGQQHGPEARMQDEVARFAADVLPHVSDPRSASVAHHLVRESERMRRLSFVTLGGVAGLMSIAVMVVLFAGLITSIDLSGTLSPVEKAQRYADASAQTLRQLSADKLFLQRLNEEQKTFVTRAEDGSSVRDDITDYANMLENIAPPDTDVRGLRLNSYRSVIDASERPQFSSDPAAYLGFIRREFSRSSADLELIDEELARARDDAKAAQELLRSARAADVTAPPTAERQQATEALIASAVTRFGVIVVLMFLAQALINLYRYALRLSAFYRSRAVMMALTDGDAEKLEAVAKTLSADHVSLGREPRSPIEEAKRLAEIAKDLKP